MDMDFIHPDGDVTYAQTYTVPRYQWQAVHERVHANPSEYMLHVNESAEQGTRDLIFHLDPEVKGLPKIEISVGEDNTIGVTVVGYLRVGVDRDAQLITVWVDEDSWC